MIKIVGTKLLGKSKITLVLYIQNIIQHGKRIFESPVYGGGGDAGVFTTVINVVSQKYI